MGSVSIPLKEIVVALFRKSAGDPVLVQIIWNFRLTKAFTCILAGSALALSGLLMQTFFRNPLAGPDVLGLSSGASLAVSLVLLGSNVSMFNNIAGPWSIALAASAGCAFTFFLVLIFARKLRDAASLLIVGLMIGAGTASVVGVLQYFSNAQEVQTFLMWTFGNVGGMNWVEIQVLLAIALTGATLAYFSSKSLNAWLLGDNYALSLGINLRRSRFLIILSASILTGAVTAFCGPISFVGIAVPHLTKLLVNTYNHRVLIPCVMSAGGVLLLLCDIIAQLPGGGHVLPLNVVTALFGAPVVIWVIMRGKKISV